MRLHSNLLLHEKLDYIALGETLEEQINRAKEVAKLDVTFPVFMRMSVNSAEKITGIPEGMPETYKPDTNLPDGISNTNARQEFRRIKNFLPNGPMQNVPAHKRELSWIQMLEGMHWKEANILVHIKDQTLHEVYPNMLEVLTKLGAPVTIVSAQEAQTKKKPKKQ